MYVPEVGAVRFNETLPGRLVLPSKTRVTPLPVRLTFPEKLKAPLIMYKPELSVKFIFPLPESPL